MASWMFFQWNPRPGLWSLEKENLVKQWTGHLSLGQAFHVPFPVFRINNVKPKGVRSNSLNRYQRSRQVIHSHQREKVPARTLLGR